MPKDQRTFTKEFKLETVQLTHTSGKSQAQVARDLGIADSTLHHWCKEFAEQGQQAFPGSGKPLAQDEEVRRFKREVEETRQERDIFKKSADHLLTRPELRYAFIAKHTSQYPVSTMCRVLEVSVSGYYDSTLQYLSPVTCEQQMK